MITEEISQIPKTPPKNRFPPTTEYYTTTNLEQDDQESESESSEYISPQHRTSNDEEKIKITDYFSESASEQEVITIENDE